MQKLIYAVFAVLLALIAIGFLLPRTHQVESAIAIDAPAATIFALLNDFRRQTEWASWIETDPSASIKFSGPARGAGATMTWNGARLGSGSQTIIDSRPYQHIEIALNPGDDGAARSWFSLTPGSGTTQVVWGFEADYGMNIVGRYFASMLGGVVASDYGESLKRLKQLAESLPSADFGNLKVEHLTVEAIDIAFLPTSSAADPDAVAESLGAAYFRVLTFIDTHGLQPDGAPLSILHRLGGTSMAFDAAIPVRGLDTDTPRAENGVRLGQTYAGAVVRAQHRGSYATLNTTQRKITAYLAATGLQRNGSPWEAYVTDPANTPEADLVTEIYYPVATDESSATND